MGLMIRFSAGEEEIAGLFRFLRRRAPENHLLLAPLSSPSPRPDRRFRRTARTLLKRMANDDGPARWGIFTTLDAGATSGKNGEDACVMILQLGEADGTGRRDALLEARDEIAPDTGDLTPRAALARNLVERCARRLRRRGTPEKGRWFIPF